MIEKIMTRTEIKYLSDISPFVHIPTYNLLHIQNARFLTVSGSVEMILRIASIFLQQSYIQSHTYDASTTKCNSEGPTWACLYQLELNGYILVRISSSSTLDLRFHPPPPKRIRGNLDRVYLLLWNDSYTSYKLERAWPYLVTKKITRVYHNKTPKNVLTLHPLTRAAAAHS